MSTLVHCTAAANPFCTSFQTDHRYVTHTDHRAKQIVNILGQVMTAQISGARNNIRICMLFLMQRCVYLAMA